VEDDDTVILGCAAVAAGEGSITQEAGASTRGEADGVDVECLGIALAKGVLHGCLLASAGSSAGEPTGVGGAVCAGQDEGQASRAEVTVHDRDLLSDLGVPIWNGSADGSIVQQC
jgi:hypothetical protein